MNVIKSKVGNTFFNLLGWHTNRKIVVIESDDWGSERMPSREIYDYLLRKNIRVDLCPYNKFDSLASESDLNNLFEVLTKFHDRNGNHPIITTNFNVANPDFKKIKEARFERYFYNTLPETYESYHDHSGSLSIWHEGINNGLVFPQYHGREHLNTLLWLELLREGHKELHIAFDVGVYGLSRITSPKIVQYHLASLIFRNNEEKITIENNLKDGIDLFRMLFGFQPRSFIAPVYIWNTEIEPTFKLLGIEYMQGNKIQTEYNASNTNHFKTKYHYLGQSNKNGQRFLVRNCFFEPTQTNNRDSVVENCLKQIEQNFKWRKPAIISSHRLNYIGYIVEENRDKNLRLLEELLRKMLAKWPDIEFMTSVDLGDLISAK